MSDSLENTDLQDLSKVKVGKLWIFSQKDRKDLVRILGIEKTKELEKERSDLYLGERTNIDITGRRKGLINISKEEKEHREKINKLLNKEYYGEEKGSFSDIGTDTFFDEGEFIFVSKLGDSRIFSFDGDKFLDTGKKYREIKKVGDYYEGIQYDPSIKHSRKIYSLISKKGEKIKSLKGNLSFREDPMPIYIDTYNKDKEKHYTIYTSDMKDILAKDVPAGFEFLFVDDGNVLFKRIQGKLFDDKEFVIVEKGNEWNYKYIDSDKIKESKIYLNYMSKLESNKK